MFSKNTYKIHIKYIRNTYKIHTKYIQNTYKIHGHFTSGSGPLGCGPFCVDGFQHLEEEVFEDDDTILKEELEAEKIYMKEKAEEFDLLNSST